MCLIKHQILKACGRVEIKIHTFLFSALGGGEWSVSNPSHFTQVFLNCVLDSSSWSFGEEKHFLLFLGLESQPVP